VDTSWLVAALFGLFTLVALAAVLVLGVHYVITRDRTAAPPPMVLPGQSAASPRDPGAGGAIEPADSPTVNQAGSDT
jgi:hypothetical protein